jgi:hypothetical protein
MIGLIARLAYRLDQWLEQTLGRPYNVILGIGLSIEIVRRLMELPEKMQSMPRVVGEAALVVMTVLLLIHQVGALSHHIEHRGPGRRGRRGVGPKEEGQAE